MDITGNPIIVTAADVAAAAVTVWKGAIHVLQVVFEEYIADTDTAVVNRLNGKQFVSLNGSSDLQSVRVGNLGWTVDGLVVPIGGITNGKVSIYIK